MKLQNYYLTTPIGTLKISGDNNYIYSIVFAKKRKNPKFVLESIRKCAKQLSEYFKGKRKSFSFKIKFSGTTFQKKVWKELRKIPYGRIVSYSDIAKKIGRSAAVRAVGNANKKNKLTIVIPCHRVISKNGSLSGYAGGVDKKKWLITFELSNLK